ncbi:MAG: hypothetical protein HC798_02940 [Polaribacter sp.]|nr:hypothetical protein [Polaribacter sp.]
MMSQKGLVNQITSSFLIGFGAITHILNETKNKFLLVISILCLILAMVSYLIPSYWYASILLIGLGFVVKGVVKDKF